MYCNDKLIFSKINLVISKKDKITITAENKSEKSTLVKTLLSLEKISKGRILIDLNRLSSTELFSYILQHCNHSFKYS